MSRTRYRQGLPPFARGMPRWDRWFANSSLEGEGFEPSVPRRERRSCRVTETVTGATRVISNGASFTRDGGFQSRSLQQ